MASSASPCLLQISTNNPFSHHLLSDLSDGFVDRSLLNVNTNSERIRKITTIVKKVPFHSEQDAAKNYIESSEEAIREWNPPPEDLISIVSQAITQEMLELKEQGIALPEPSLLDPRLVSEISQAVEREAEELREGYDSFLRNQIQIVKTGISEDLVEIWSHLKQQVEPKLSLGYPLAFIEGTISIQIDTVERKNEKSEAERVFTIAYRIINSNQLGFFPSTSKEQKGQD